MSNISVNENLQKLIKAPATKAAAKPSVHQLTVAALKAQHEIIADLRKRLAAIEKSRK